METIYIIQKLDKRSQSVTVVSSHRDRDVAELLTVRYNQNNRDLVKFFVTESSLDECERVQANTEGDFVFLDNDIEEGERLYFEVNISHHGQETNHYDGYPCHTPAYVEIDSIKFCGKDLRDLNISDELKEDIEHQAENIKEREEERI